MHMQVCDMVDACKWTDKLIELQLWTRLAYVAFEARDHALTSHTALKALRFADIGTAPRTKKVEP